MLSNLAQKHTNSPSYLLQKTKLHPIFLRKKKTYYVGAKYLDAKTSRWLSVDPAMHQGDYIPSAPINDEAKKRNENLPGMGGVFKYVIIGLGVILMGVDLAEGNGLDHTTNFINRTFRREQ